MNLSDGSHLDLLLELCEAQWNWEQPGLVKVDSCLVETEELKERKIAEVEVEIGVGVELVEVRKWRVVK